jgi:hypothetical protein
MLQHMAPRPDHLPASITSASTDLEFLTKISSDNIPELFFSRFKSMFYRTSHRDFFETIRVALAHGYSLDVSCNLLAVQ